MNHIYRVIFNKSTQTFQAVAETSKGQGKSHSQKQVVSDSKFKRLRTATKPLVILISISLTSALSTVAIASPTGGQVSAGQANISQNGLTTNINQSSQNSAINWQDFSIKPNETVNFKQPNANAITLNRVLGNEKSVIKGAMNANGKVFIQNPNGTLIGNNAQINVGGLVATTAKISDDNFMAGNYQFNGGADGSIENLGTITVPEGGLVALIAPVVKHQGKITAPKADVLLASAERFSITLPDTNGIGDFRYTLDKGTLEGLVDNGGAILADGGHVVLTSLGVDAVKKSVIRHTGVIEANTVRNDNGVIELLGDLDNSELQLSGTLKAEATGNGDGGFIETSASKLDIDDNSVVSTKAENGETGTWLIDPKDFIVADFGGDMTGQQVSTALDSNNVTLKSTEGQAEGKGDVIVNDTINWNQNKLTLIAEHDIHINKTMNGSGTAKLALEYGQGDNNSEADYYLDKDTSLIDRDVQINLPKGKSFSTKKGENGGVVEFDVIHKMPDIHADGTTETFTSNNIAVGKDIDLTGVGNSEFLGWTVEDTEEEERFEGLGHSISNLNIKYDAPNIDKTKFRKIHSSSSYYPSHRLTAGLFRESPDSVKNLVINNTVMDISVNHPKENSNSSYYTSYNISAGALAGFAHEGEGSNYNFGTTQNIHIKNAKINIQNTIKEHSKTEAGLLYGFIQPYNINDISNLHTSGDITSYSDSQSIGGVIGEGGNGHYSAPFLRIKSVSSDANVSSFSEHGATGGIIGKILGSVGKANFSGSVDGKNNVGGIAGEIEGGGIFDSQVNAKLIGNENVGGLVGSLNATGLSNASIGSSTSKSEVKGVKNVGGLAGSAYVPGYSSTNLENVYSEGEVIGEENVGGLIGFSDGSTNAGRIKSSYANALIKSPNSIQNIGGLVGETGKHTNYPDTVNISNSYYNQDKNPTITKDVGNKPEQDYDKVDTELKQEHTFNSWNFNDVWRIDEGNDYPRLQALTEATIVIDPSSLDVKANDLSKTYDGKSVDTQADLEKLDGWSGTGVSSTGLLGGDTLDSSVFSGELTFDGTGSDWQGAKDAGDYTIVPTGLGSQKYEIKWGKGDLTINPAPLTLNGNSTYNATTKVQGSNQNLDIKGIQGSDIHELEVTGTGNLQNKNAGTQNLISNNFEVDEDFRKNYVINPSVTWTVNPAPLTLNGERRYDSTTAVDASEITKIDGVVSGDEALTMTGTGTLKNKDIGTQTLASNNFKIDDIFAKNYVIDNDVSTWNIDKALIVIDPKSLAFFKANDLTKTYDGESIDTQADLEKLDGWNGDGVASTGLLDGDTLDSSVFTGSLKFDGTGSNWQGAKDAGNYTIVPTGLGSQKYEIKWGDGNLTIKPKKITIKANDLFKSYDSKSIDNEEDLAKADEDSWKKTGVTVQGLVESDKLSNKSIFKGNLSFTGEGNSWQGTLGVLHEPIIIKPSGLTATNYDIDYQTGNLFMVPVKITLTGKKTYSGSTTVYADEITNINGLVGDDALKIEITGTGTINSKDVGTKRLSVSNFEIDDVFAKNYVIFEEDSEWEVEKAELNIRGVKEYDTTVDVDVKDIDYEALSTEFTDDVDIKGQGRLLNRHTGTSNLIWHNFYLLGNDAKNYMINPLVEWRVFEKRLDVTAVADKKFHDGTKKSFQTPKIFGLYDSDSATAEQEFETENFGRPSTNTIRPVITEINDGNDGKNYYVEYKTAKGTIYPEEYKKYVVKEPNKISLTDTQNNIIFRKYTPDELNKMNYEEVLKVESYMINVATNNQYPKRMLNHHEKMDKVNKLLEEKIKKLHGTKKHIPVFSLFKGNVPVGGEGGFLGKSDVKALFSEKGGAFAFKTVVNTLNVYAAIQTGGFDTKSVSKVNKISGIKRLLLELGSLDELKRLADLNSAMANGDNLGTFRNILAGGVEISGLSDSDLITVYEGIFKIMSQPAETAFKGESFDEDFVIKMAGFYAEVVSGAMPPGPGKALASLAATYADQWDNARGFAKYSDEIFTELAAPIENFYNIQYDEILRQSAIENIILLQNKNSSQFVTP